MHLTSIELGQSANHAPATNIADHEMLLIQFFDLCQCGGSCGSCLTLLLFGFFVLMGATSSIVGPLLATFVVLAKATNQTAKSLSGFIALLGGSSAGVVGVGSSVMRSASFNR